MQCAMIPPLANSDHSGLLLQWIWKLPGNQTRLKPRQIWRYAQGDFERAKDMLSIVDWEQLIDPTDVNQSLLTWENYYMNVMESCIPKGILPKRNTTNKKQFWKTMKYMRLDKSTIY